MGGVSPQSTRPKQFGDERVQYHGPAYGYQATTTYLWRVNNVVLAVIGVGGTDEELVLDVARDMDDRAH